MIFCHPIDTDAYRYLSSKGYTDLLPDFNEAGKGMIAVPRKPGQSDEDFRADLRIAEQTDYRSERVLCVPADEVPWARAILQLD